MTDAYQEAPAEGAGEITKAISLLTAWSAPDPFDPSKELGTSYDKRQIKKLTDYRRLSPWLVLDTLSALRARTSEPAREAIPEGVYWSSENQNFYRMDTRAGCGTAFYVEWRDRVREFPADPRLAPATADKLKVAKEALENIADEAPYRSGYCQSDVEYGPKLSGIEMQAEARQALAALEGGEG